jgi:hypothetical protein
VIFSASVMEAVIFLTKPCQRFVLKNKSVENLIQAVALIKMLYAYRVTYYLFYAQNQPRPAYNDQRIARRVFQYVLYCSFLPFSSFSLFYIHMEKTVFFSVLQITVNNLQRRH